MVVKMKFKFQWQMLESNFKIWLTIKRKKFKLKVQDLFILIMHNLNKPNLKSGYSQLNLILNLLSVILEIGCYAHNLKDNNMSKSMIKVIEDNEKKDEIKIEFGNSKKLDKLRI